MRGFHAFGVDDNADNALALRQILFFVWVTFAEHKWIILDERRRTAAWRVGSSRPLLLCRVPLDGVKTKTSG